ncbi:MAG: hypothetical protein WA117_04190 [Verrucomicrobiia bacterium]
MTFKSEINLGDIIASASFFVAAVGLFLTAWQLRRDSIRKRAEFIVSFLNQFIADPNTSKLFYQLEYEGGFRYDPADFHGSEQERHLDRLLGYFEKIAALYQMGVITRQDLELIRYEYVRVFQHGEVQKYFCFLDTLPRTLGVSGGTFSRYRKVAAMLSDG